MHSFLRNTAASILQEYQELQNLVIVLPNRRAGLFFTQHLGALIEKSTWMPEVKTIEDVFYQYAGQRPSDDLTLIFELYKVYQSLHPEPETFDRFYFWGEMILKTSMTWISLWLMPKNYISIYQKSRNWNLTLAF